MKNILRIGLLLIFKVIEILCIVGFYVGFFCLLNFIQNKWDNFVYCIAGFAVMGFFLTLLPLNWYLVKRIIK